MTIWNRYLLEEEVAAVEIAEEVALEIEAEEMIEVETAAIEVEEEVAQEIEK